MNKRLLILILSLIGSHLFAQSTSQLSPKVIPPSPNAAALQRYGDIPVSPYTGVPNISIPIYNISVGGLSMPISINYHASGIKVADEASRVGLGWALNAGGIISRTIMGKDDFFSNPTEGYHLDINTPDLQQGYRGWPSSSFSIQKESSINVGSINNLPNLLYTNHEFQPDTYSFNVGNSSGKFFLKRNKEVVLGNREKILIRCMDANAEAWEIQTNDGIKYKFEISETYTESGSSAGYSAATHKTAWYLTQIISPNGETISLQYSTNSGYLRPLGSFFESNNPSTILTTTPINCSRSADPYQSLTTVSPGKDYKNVILEKIIFKNGELKFNYDNNRIDVLNDFKLTSIALNTINFSGNPQLNKQWNFSYSYFTGTATNAFLATGSSQETKRLKLDAITEKDAFGNSLDPHVFTYYNDDTYTNTYPSKASYSRDHWGYYNGKPNSSLIPAYFPSSVPSNPALTYLGSMGDNREPSSIYPTLFSLKEIKYPTGGKTSFEYETHDYDIEKSNINDHSFYAKFPEPTPKQIHKMYYPITTQMPTASDLADKTLDLTDMYGNVTSKVNLTSFFRFGNTMSSCSFQPGIITFKLTRDDGAIFAQSDLADWLGASSQPMATCDPPSNPVGITFKNSYNLPPGKYIWRINIAPGYTQLLDVSLVIDYVVVKPMQEITNGGDVLAKAGLGGGLRIKKISDYTSDNADPKVMKYFYHYTGSDGKMYSYGRRMARPIYSYYDDSWTFTDCPTTNMSSYVTSQHLIRESDSNVPLNGSASGSTVGYDTVIVYRGENAEFGKTVYHFENQPDMVWDYGESSSLFGVTTTLPRKPPLQGSFSNATNGNLLNQIEFEKSGSTFLKVKEVSNNYTEMLGQNNVLWWGIERRNYNGSVPSAIIYPFRAYVYPAFVETRKLLTSITSTIYDKINPAIVISTTTNNTYNNDSHFQLTSSSQTNSKGDQIINSYTYPLDYSNVNADNAIISMKGTAFMHSKVISNNTSIQKSGTTNKVLIGSTINKFQLINGKVLQKEVAALEITSGIVEPPYLPVLNTYPTGYKSKIQYDLFDAEGNVLQVSKVNDIKESYIWGYNKQYPVAQVVGAAHVNASSFIKQSILDNPLSTDLDIGTELNKIRIGLANTKALVTTYTYKPLVGMTSQTDPNNRTTYYSYDAFNRLKLILDQNGKIIKKICYKSFNQPENCTTQIYSSLAIASNITPTINCPSGQLPAPVYITVNAGQSVSALSQQHANELAKAYALQLANQQGTCFVPIYARTEYEGDYVLDDQTSEYHYYNQYVNVWVRFYSDPLCTQPYTLTEDLSIIANVKGMWWDPSGTSFSSYSINKIANSGSNSVQIDNNMSLYGYQDYFEEGGIVYFEKWSTSYEVNLSIPPYVKPLPFYNWISLPVWY